MFKDSAPCSDCTRVIKGLNIKKIIYSKDDGSFDIVKTQNYTTKHISLGRRLLADPVAQEKIKKSSKNRKY
jgi:deoxycytidylate deaminase